MTITDQVAWWIGVIVLGSVSLALVVGAWWLIITKVLANMKETWWITAYCCYKRRWGPEAKKHLERAIHCEKNWKDPKEYTETL